MRLGVEPSTAGIRQGRCESVSEPCRPVALSPSSIIHGQPGSPAWSGWSGWSLGKVARLPFWHFAPFLSLRTSRSPDQYNADRWSPCDVQRPAARRSRRQSSCGEGAVEVQHHQHFTDGRRTSENAGTLKCQETPCGGSQNRDKHLQ